MKLTRSGLLKRVALSLCVLAFLGVLLEAMCRVGVPNRSEVFQTAGGHLIVNPHAEGILESAKHNLRNIRIPLESKDGNGKPDWFLVGDSIQEGFLGPNSSVGAMTYFLAKEALGEGGVGACYNLAAGGTGSLHASRVVKSLLGTGKEGLILLHTGHNQFLPQECAYRLARLNPRSRLSQLLWFPSLWHRSRLWQCFIRMPLLRSGEEELHVLSYQNRDLIIDGFRKDLEAIVEAVQATRSSRLFLFTVLKNQELPPHVVYNSYNLLEGDRKKRFAACVETGIGCLRSGEPLKSVEALEEASALAEHDGMIHYLLAQAHRAARRACEHRYRESGDESHRKASEYHRKQFASHTDDAGRFDAIPTRAPPEINEIILAQAGKARVTVIDTTGLCERRPDEICGSGDFLDHCHPDEGLLFEIATHAAGEITSLLLDETRNAKRALGSESSSMDDYLAARPLSRRYRAHLGSASYYAPLLGTKHAQDQIEHAQRARRTYVRMLHRVWALMETASGELAKGDENCPSFSRELGSLLDLYGEASLGPILAQFPEEIAASPLFTKFADCLSILEAGNPRHARRVLERAAARHGAACLRLAVAEWNSLLEREDLYTTVVRGILNIRAGRLVDGAESMSYALKTYSPKELQLLTDRNREILEPLIEYFTLGNKVVLYRAPANDHLFRTEHRQYRSPFLAGPDYGSASLTLTAAEPLASLWLDGERIEALPFKADLEAGFHEIKCLKKGADLAESRTVFVQPGENEVAVPVRSPELPDFSHLGDSIALARLYQSVRKHLLEGGVLLADRSRLGE